MLGRAVQSYLAVRRATGYTLKGVGLHLLRISRKEGQRFTACRSTVSHQVGPVLVRQDVVDFHSVTYAGQALDGYPRARARAH